MPSLVRIVSIYILGDVGGGRPQILFIDNAVIADQEALHTCDMIVGRKSQQCEAPDHSPINHIVELPKASCRTLPLEYLEVVAVVARGVAGRITFLDGASNCFADRTARRAILVLPI